jgi:outer membrane protein
VKTASQSQQAAPPFVVALGLSFAVAVAAGPQAAHAQPAASPAPAALAARWDLDALLREAVAKNPGVAAKARAVDAANAERRAMAGRFAPVFRTEINAMLWNSDNVYAFDTSGFNQLFAQLGAPAGTTVPPMTVKVRDQLMAKVTVMAIQPLVQLWQIDAGYQAKKGMAKAATLDEVTARRELELSVARAYYGHIGARAMLDTLVEADKTVAAYEKQTRDYIAAGFLERDALLKVLVQKEEIARNRAAVEKGIALTRAQLNMLMARPLDAPLELACADCDVVAEADQPVPDLAALQASASQNRPELNSGRAQRDAAKSGYDAAFAKLLPDLNLIGLYNHNAGMGDLMLRNEAAVGLSLAWNFWDWGANYGELRAADARRQQAELAVQAAEDGLRLQVHEKVLELDEARKQYRVAVATLSLAEEALRIEENRYAVRETETADLLKAQSTALKARHDRTIAALNIKLADQALAVAAGRDLLGDAAPFASENTR